MKLIIIHNTYGNDAQGNDKAVSQDILSTFKTRRKNMLDLTGVDASTEFKGELPMTITKATEKVSQNNNKYWALEFTVFGDKFKGRKVIESFVLNNDFAKQRLAQIVDITDMQRSGLEVGMFLNKQVIGKVMPNKDDEYSSLKGFKRYEKPTDFPV